MVEVEVKRVENVHMTKTKVEQKRLIHLFTSMEVITLQEGEGLLKPPSEQKWQFKHLLVIQLSQTYLTFPGTLWGCLS